MRTRRLLTGVVALLFAVAFLILSPRPAPSPRNTIIILIDTLRADHLGIYGYERDTTPVLDAFAGENAFYKRAIAAAPWTPPSVTTILSGVYPSTHLNMPHRHRTTAQHKGTRVPEDIMLMQQFFKDAGYRTAALSSNPWITPAFGFGKGFDTFEFRDHAAAEEMIGASKELIDDLLKTGEDPFFFYLHLMDPHNPFNARPGFEFNGPLKARNYDKKALNLISKYDSEVRYMDHHLGNFLEYLRSRNVYEQASMIILADHGEQFRERGGWGHGKNLHIEEVHIPLLVRLPGLKGAQNETVSHVDILPTMLELLNRPAPASLPGISLFDKRKIASRAGVYSEACRKYTQRAFTQSQYRLITKVSGKNDANSTLNVKGFFDNLTDPFEIRPLENAELIDELFSRLKEASASAMSGRAAEEVDIDPETVEKLRTLGYMK